MAKKGWHGQSARHSLAARGMKTTCHKSATQKAPGYHEEIHLSGSPSIDIIQEAVGDLRQMVTNRYEAKEITRFEYHVIVDKIDELEAELQRM